MISKKLFVFGTLIYLNCLCLVGSNINLIQRYKEVLNRGLNDKEHYFCTSPHKTIWVSACKTIVNRIKQKEGSEYRNSLFLNYFLFGATTSPWCVKNEVRFVNVEDVSVIGSRSVTQMMMPCYTRRDAVIPTENYTDEYLEKNDFYIYPENIQSWLLFKYDYESQSYELYEWFDIEKFVTVYSQSQLLSKLPPLRISNNNKYALVLSSLSNEDSLTWQNIVMRAGGIQFKRLCSISYECMPYSEHLVIYSLASYKSRTPPVKKVLIRIPGLEKRFELYARDCLMYLRDQSSKTASHEYRLSPGPSMDSILLLKTSIATDGVEENDVLEAIVSIDTNTLCDLFSQ